jgi:general secretion pathway protein E
LTRLNNAERNILTVEDPIEYDLDGVGQTQVNTKINMSFARGLRAILRQDPDVVMVGEIRDLETAQIAVQASLTGHLVLSTLHTNSGIGAITRLRDMGVESFLLSSSLLATVAQRLVRVLCPECKQPYTASEEQCRVMEVDSQAPPRLFKAEGCKLCQQRGYMGRTGIYEVIAIDDTLQNMIHDNASEQKLRDYVQPLYPSLRQDGWRQVLNGTTSMEEVLRVTKEG